MLDEWGIIEDESVPRDEIRFVEILNPDVERNGDEIRIVPRQRELGRIVGILPQQQDREPPNDSPGSEHGPESPEIREESRMNRDP